MNFSTLALFVLPTLALVPWATYAARFRRRRQFELDAYTIGADANGLEISLQSEDRRVVKLHVDPRVAYQLSDDLTRAAIRAAPRKGGDS